MVKVMDGVTEQNTLQPKLKAYAEALRILGLCSQPPLMEIEQTEQ